MKIDAHQHFWNPARGDYGWMPENDPVLTRVFTPADLATGLSATGITATVLVQAAPSVQETEYLLGIADATPHVAAVVGWIDFEDMGQLRALERLARHRKFVGVRPMIQDIADDGWMLRPDIAWAYEAIVDLDLTFDALGFPRHLENFHTLLKRHPFMRTVIDHCMKPQLRDHSEENFARWADGMSRLAVNTGAFCKLSGLLTEADVAWDIDVLRRHTDHVLAAFGPDRVMWGSDWPVLRLRCEYEDWFSLANELTVQLAADQREAVFGKTAARFYRIGNDI